MAELVIRGAKLFPASRTSGAPSYATAFIYEPDPSRQKLGELYAVVEILSAAKNPEKVADLIIETFGRAFYEELEEGEELSDTETSERFDRAVKSTNQALSHLAGQDDATWIGKTSAAIAVAAGKELHLTYTGSSEAYLFRKGKLARINAPSSEDRHQTHKPFTSIASGHLDGGDRIVLCTPALTRILATSELSHILDERSANAAANQIAEKIETQNGAERVAAVVAEVTTAEIISSQPLPDEPAEVVHGTKTSWFQNAKDKTLPVLATAHKHAKPIAKKTAQAARHGWHLTKTKVAPAAKHHGLNATAWLRGVLRDPKKAKVALAASAIVIILLGILVGRAVIGGGQSKLANIYDQALTSTREGQQLWLEGNKAGAEDKLEAARKQMQELQSKKPGKKFDEHLSKRQHPDYDPASVSGLNSLIQDLLDQIAGLTRVSPKEIANLGEIKDRQPKFSEFTGNKVVIVGGTDSPVIATVDPRNGKVSVSKANSSALGRVIDTTASSEGDGVYILTAKTEVWLYKPSNDSLAKQQGPWQAGKAIGSFGGNIYILKSDNSQILRFARTGSSFGDPTNYLVGGQASRLAGMSAITVDGSVLTGGSNKVHRFFTGSLAQTASGTPESFKGISQLSSIADGEIIVALGSSGRIGVYSFDGDSLTFLKQYVLTNGEGVKSVTPSSDISIYGLFEDKLVQFNQVP